MIRRRVSTKSQKKRPCSKTGGRNGGRFTLGRSTAVLGERAAGAFRRSSTNARWGDFFVARTAGNLGQIWKSGELESGEKWVEKLWIRSASLAHRTTDEEEWERQYCYIVTSSPRSLAMPFYIFHPVFLYLWYFMDNFLSVVVRCGAKPKGRLALSRV